MQKEYFGILMLGEKGIFRKENMIPLRIEEEENGSLKSISIRYGTGPRAVILKTIFPAIEKELQSTKESVKKY